MAPYMQHASGSEICETDLFMRNVSMSLVRHLRDRPRPAARLDVLMRFASRSEICETDLFMRDVSMSLARGSSLSSS